MLDGLAVNFFLGAMLLAALSDAATYTIPNWLSAGVAAAFVPAAFYAGMPLEEMGIHLLIGGIVLFIGMGLFAFRLLGGGDAKLLAAASLWIGLSALMPFLFWTAAAGGALGLGLIAFRRVPLPEGLAQLGWIARLHDPRAGIPYGIAIALGAFVAFGHSRIFALTVLG